MIPYERIVQWTAGPIAILSGWLATVLVSNVGVVSELGLNQSKVASGIVAGVTFAVGTAVTYAAHHKWLSNLAKWWDVQAATPILTSGPDVSLTAKLESARTPDGPPPEPTVVPVPVVSVPQ